MNSLLRIYGLYRLIRLKKYYFSLLTKVVCDGVNGISKHIVEPMFWSHFLVKIDVLNILNYTWKRWVDLVHERLIVFIWFHIGQVLSVKIL